MSPQVVEAVSMAKSASRQMKEEEVGLEGASGKQGLTDQVALLAQEQSWTQTPELPEVGMEVASREEGGLEGVPTGVLAAAASAAVAWAEGERESRAEAAARQADAEATAEMREVAAAVALVVVLLVVGGGAGLLASAGD